MPGLEFIINRLMRMSPPEIGYRVFQKLQNTWESSAGSGERLDIRLSGGSGVLFSRDLEIESAEAIISKADRIVEHRFDLFSLKDYYFGAGIDYHKDYKHGVRAPADIFGKKIDYRDNEKNGDIKYIWEINRHLFMVPLALAWHVTRDDKYKHKFEYFLTEWMEQNPFMRGVNWTSSLELGIRLINWTIAWHIIGSDLEEELKARWLDSIYRHCWFINRNLSAFSSANNHLMGEAAGLFIASTALPAFKASQGWRQKAFGILVRECEKQNYPDGVNKEQAISYQQFVLDFLLLAGLTGEANNIAFPANYWLTIERMLVYLASIEDNCGNLCHYGDEDDGFVTDMMQREYGIYRSLMNTGAYLFGRQELLKGSGTIDQKTLLLLNIGKRDSKPRVNMGQAAKEECALPLRFDKGGYYLLGECFGSSTEQKLLFDCGSLGYLSISAHGHADALSFWYSAAGQPIFVDPGTYAYHADRKWRSYFRSTAAHNTVRLDGKDQSVMTGNFMWSRKAKAKLLEYRESESVTGWHDGYLPLPGRPRHIREISFIRSKNLWRITDTVESTGDHLVELFFHIHPDCRLEMKEEQMLIYFKSGCTVLMPGDGVKAEAILGDETIPLGWYSPSYDVKLPAATVRMTRVISGTESIVTEFSTSLHAGLQ